MNTLSRSRLSTFALLSLLIAFHAAPAGAAQPNWVPLGPPDGASLTALAFDPTNENVVYAGVWRGGVFKSLDGGRTWSLSSDGLYAEQVNALAVDPRDPRRVYAGATDGFYWSRDGGRNWFHADLRRDVLAIAVDARRAGGLTIATRNGLFRSTDGGAHWIETSRGLFRDARLYAPALAAAPSRPQRLYASYIGYRNRVLRSDDAGQSWIPVSRRDVRSLAVDPADPDLVYSEKARSTDGGTTWTLLPESFSQVVTLPSRPGVVVGVRGESLSISTDEGRTFQPLTRLGREIRTLVASPTRPASWLAGTAGAGLQRSDDSGRTWRPSRAGLGGFNATLVRIVPERNAIFTAGGSGLYRTTDGGASWDRVLPNAPVTALAVDPSDPDTLFAGALAAGGASSFVTRSKDGGDTWTTVAAELSPGPISDLIVLPTEPRTVYASIFTGDIFTNLPGLFSSPDGGASWYPVPGVAEIADLEWDPADPAVIYATQDRGILRSADRGQNWWLRTVGRPGGWARRTRRIAIAPSDSNHLAVIDPYSLFLSPDEGRSWQLNRTWGPNLCWSVTFDPRDADTLYVGLAEGVFRSRDGGATWSFFSRGLPGVAVSDLTFDPADPSKLYAATSSAGVFVVDLEP